MSVLLLAAAVVASAVATLIGFGVLDGGHDLGWLSLGVCCLAAAGLVAHIPRLP